MPPVIEQPAWRRINDLCIDKIESRFPKYGNTWKWDCHLNTKKWNHLVQGEVDELKEKTYEDRIEELIDVINICAMELTNRLRIKYDGVFTSRHD